MNLRTPSGYRNAHSPEDLKNATFVVRARLMSTHPLPESEWTERYAGKFLKLSETDDEFREMLATEISPANLHQLQERLDEE